jgi:hypothetical protein
LAVTRDFYTYQQDVRAAFGGSPVAYVSDSTLTVANGGTPLFQGEMVALKVVGNSKTIVRFVRDNTAGNFVGITRDSQQGTAKLGNQPALLQMTQIELSVFTTGIHQMLGTVGETYSHGQPVFMSSTALQTDTITSAAGTNGAVVGVVWLPDNSTRVGAVRVPILIDNHTLSQIGTQS